MWSLAVPFNIPDGWVWVHPTDIGFFGSGKTPAPDQLSKFGTIPYFKVADMNATGNEVYLCHSNSFLKLPNSMKLFSKGAVVYPKNGGAVFTNKKRILGQDSLVDLNTGSYTPFSQMDEKFFYYLFSTVDFQKYYKGTALPTVDMDAVQEIVWALPPLAEQKRIVTAIELTLPLIDKYEETHSQLSRLQHSFPEALKKSILQEAVQGKLVPQDPSDEPAEALLERIRTEKQRLIKEGKIKKDKHESVIFRRDNSHYEKLDGMERCIDDELPFEIPESWAWVRWGSIAESIQYGYNSPAKQEGRIRMVRISDIHENTVAWSSVPFCDIDDSDIPTYLLQANDILFARTGGTVGKSFLVSEVPCESIYAGYLIRTRYSSLLCPQYLKYFMESPLYWQQLKSGTTATAQPNCNGQTLAKMLLPLPPANEQLRIVDNLARTFTIIEKM